MDPSPRNSALRILLAAALLYASANAIFVGPSILDVCPGYSASNVRIKGDGLTADLVLKGAPCDVFGNDIEKLSLSVVYETVDRVHVKITDASAARYEVPESVLPRPDSEHAVSPQAAAIRFNYTASPFSFSIHRASTQEVLFTTHGHPLIFEPQYLRVKTKLPDNANIYGLGEHTNAFRLPPDITLALWASDVYGVPTNTNLYSSHPVYFEHRPTGTHGVLLLNSNGMDVKLTGSDAGGPALEYNVIGGVLDFYFLAGSETDPTAVARQYAAITGFPAEVPYWTFGLHQCRFGYQNFVDVANVITNYSVAGIPLETMWTDIDYMDRLRAFTLDPDYFPLARVREIVDYLHAHNQKYVLTSDPAIPYLPNQNYLPYDNGNSLDVFMKSPNGSEYLSLVWPGVTVFPDWFHPKSAEFWKNEFARFHDLQTGIDVDGAWIDVNEPATFCILPCDDPFQQAKDQNIPPARPAPPPDRNTPIFVTSTLSRRDLYLNPPYAISNGYGDISSKTAHTNIKHANGLMEYDTHNLYGTMMSVITRDALLARRPGKRPFVITRSTFVGAGAQVGKWLGDNMSLWEHYRFSIAGMLRYASVFQVPMIGSDICGFAGDTTENLCARWAMLGAFYPFMRNHNADTTIPQEFYRWETVAEAARNAIGIRYRLMDYLYTAFHQAHVDGTPVLHPVWFKYPKDANTYAIEYQFFFGDAVLVSPVTVDDATAVLIYLPCDAFYDFVTLAPIAGHGSHVVLDNVNFTTIPLHIKGGTVLPLRTASAMTTTELRTNDFEFVVAPDAGGKAAGRLYVDDGESITPTASTQVAMSFESGTLDVSGKFGYATGVNVSRIRFLAVGTAPKQVYLNSMVLKSTQFSYDTRNKVLDVTVREPFVHGFSVQYEEYISPHQLTAYTNT
ncbi:glycoside hydrolase family 31 protein [Hypholoma sublateritium FD-334 SS-4]|uniref:beta-glucosidase n=1 Tax=Hypholoma sublateritium (strain FD-334 SS-4) TaxID=945553 RepID=A0A0D2LWH8_HYPSF|nr:glycoside hydrolase family 31 protein [Hypholoma sublateritium FD-334 SS-4]